MNFLKQYSSFLFLFVLAVFLTACSQDTDSSTDAVSVAESVPQLLDRSEAIQYSNEWTNIQNQYGKFRQELIENPDALEPRLYLAQLFVMEARVTGEHGHYYPAALKMVNEILDANPEDQNLRFMALTTKAGVQLSQHEFKDALATAEEAVQLNPYNAQIYGALVDAHVELGNYEKAVETADKMVAIRPDLRSYSRVSYLREIHGEVDGAIEAMDMAVAAGYPGYEQTAWARLTLGDLYLTYGELDKAEEQYKTILQDRPDYPFAVAALAEVEMERKNYEKAEELLHKAKAIIPEVGFYEQLAHIYKETGRQEEMQAMLDEIYPMLEDDVNSGHNMDMEYAALYRDLVEDYDKALEYAKREFEKRPNNIDVNKLMASILVKKGDLAEAQEYLAKAEVTNYQHPELVALKEKVQE